VDVPACRVCGLAILEVIDHGRDLYDGLCGDCAYQKFMLQHRLSPVGGEIEACEWCSEPGPLTEYLDPGDYSASWVCARCRRGAEAKRH